LSSLPWASSSPAASASSTSWRRTAPPVRSISIATKPRWSDNHPSRCLQARTQEPVRRWKRCWSKVHRSILPARGRIHSGPSGTSRTREMDFAELRRATASARVARRVQYRRSISAMSDVKKVVLAYSGGLDTSIIIPWIKENYGGAEIVAYCGDVGQGDDLEAVRKKAFATGASDCVVEDLREEFVRDYAFKALAAGAVYEDKYLLGTALARPLLAYGQVRTALRIGADALAHGATGKGNDQVRFEVTYGRFAPHLKVIAPWREWTIRSREDALAYAAAHGVPVD